MGQIIVPIYRTEKQQQYDDDGLAVSCSSVQQQQAISCSGEGDGLREVLHADFQVRVGQLQAEARRSLLLARQEAHRQLLEQTAEARRQHRADLYALVGIQQQQLGQQQQQLGRLNRRLLSRLTLGQLNVILNDFLGKSEAGRYCVANATATFQAVLVSSF